jgi:thiamine biosynthesis lipoprotein
MKRALLLLGIVATCLALWRKQPAGPTVLTGRAMGCEWRLVTDEAVAAEQLRGEIAAVLEHWEQVLSTWRPDSDLSRHNRGEPATADLARVLELAERLRAESGGAFDHRLLGALTAAGFGPGGSGIDLSSLGKGFAVDRVAEMLDGRGFHRHVFSLAGEVRAGDGEWPVGIESPTGGIAETLVLSNQSMATSGNYRQGRPAGKGRVAGHILDPASGRPVVRPPCGVTVIAADAATASGWATALFVKGPRASPPPGMRVIWDGGGG